MFVVSLINEAGKITRVMAANVDTLNLIAMQYGLTVFAPSPAPTVATQADQKASLASFKASMSFATAI